MAVDCFDLIHSLAHVGYKQCPDYDGDVLKYHDRLQRAKRFLPTHEIRPSDNFFLNGCAIPNHLVENLAETVDKNLIGTSDASLVPKNHCYFTVVKDFCRRWNIPEQARLNFERLLRGNLRFPVLLLENPTTPTENPSTR